MSTNSKIQINQTTLEETVKHITLEFPYMASLCDLHDYPDNMFPWHWHNEVEFFYMRKGSLKYTLPSGSYTFQQGEGGFINANILHTTCCDHNQPCIQEEHIFLPQFIGGQTESIFMQKYINPVITNSDFEFFKFQIGNKDHEKVIGLLNEAYECYEKKELYYEFFIREIMTQVWRSFLSFIGEMKTSRKVKVKNDRIKTMMKFIATHYNEELTLKQIADSSYISVRECCRCFQDNLGLTPFSYLIDYRLHKACDLLSHTTLPITIISSACGFNTSSYFSKVFREKFGCTPKVYRNQNEKLNL